MQEVATIDGPKPLLIGHSGPSRCRQIFWCFNDGMRIGANTSMTFCQRLTFRFLELFVA